MHFNQRQKPKRKFDSGGFIEGLHKALDWFTGSTIPVKVQNFLKTNGDTIISKLTVCRAPISKTLDLAIDIVSQGKFAQVKNKVGYDEFFHLKVVINDKFILEKNELFNTGPYVPDAKADLRDVSVLDGLTISKFLENASKGDEENFYRHYQPFGANCQQMVKRLLEKNGLLTQELKKFIFQDVQEIVKAMPDTVKTATDITDVASLINRLVQLGSGGRVSLAIGDKNIRERREANLRPKFKTFFKVV